METDAPEVRRDTLAKDQLDAVYARVDQGLRASSNLRNWCITVWAGLVAVGASGTIHLGRLQTAVLLVGIITTFWILDVLQHMYIRFHLDQARRLEDGINRDEPFTAEALAELAPVGGWVEVDRTTKFRWLIRGGLATWTLWSFFGALVLLTLMLAYFGFITPSPP